MRKALSLKKIFFIFTALIFCGFFIFFAILGAVNSNKIISGVKIGPVSVGGKNFEDFRSAIVPIINIFLSREVSLIIEGEKYQATFNQLGVDIDIEKSFQGAVQIGKDENFLKNIFKQIQVFISGKSVEFSVSFSEQRLEEYLIFFKSYEVKPQDATVYFDDMTDDFDYLMSFNGKAVDREKLKHNLAYRAINLEPGTDLNIVFVTVYPEITDQIAQNAVHKTRDFLDSAPKEIKLQFNGDVLLPVDSETISSWISTRFDVIDDNGKKMPRIFFDGEKISEYLIQISQNINEESSDAILTYKNKRVEAFQLSRDGRRLNIEESAMDIIIGLQNNEAQIDLTVDIIKPRISTDQIENLGLTALLATGQSDFSGSSQSRTHNIKIGAAKFNGILLTPKEEFSFNQFLGEVDEGGGYLPELVIKNDGMVYDYGGGICQVSTTVFRAAVLAGLEITERHPHFFPVKYYNPQGFDATVYPPSPDLKFVNNTPNNLLIQTKVRGTKLYFDFYGTNDGRKIVLTGPEVYDKKSNGAMKARLTREVFDKDGNLANKVVFQSNYSSPNLFPVATKNPYE